MFWKISIFFENFEKLYFSQIFNKKLDFDQNFRKDFDIFENVE